MSFDLAGLSGSASEDDLDISEFFASPSPHRDHGDDTNEPPPSSNSEADNFDNDPLADFSPAHLSDEVDDGSFGDNEQVNVAADSYTWKIDHSKGHHKLRGEFSP